MSLPNLSWLGPCFISVMFWPLHKVILRVVSLLVAQSQSAIRYIMPGASFLALMVGVFMSTFLPSALLQCMHLCVCCLWVEYLVLLDWFCLDNNAPKGPVAFLIWSWKYRSVVIGGLHMFLTLHIISLPVFFTLMI